MKSHKKHQQINKTILIDIFKFIFVIALLCWMTFRGTEKLGYNWQWFQVPRYLFRMDDTGFLSGPLLNGFIVTLKITAASMVLAVFSGFITAILRLSNSISGRLTAFSYVETVRNTPLLVQIFFIYFVISPIFGISPFISAVFALSLFEGAYISEIFRAGILSVDKGQWEAAYSLSLSTFDTYFKIILPQAVRKILPPLTGQAVSLIKDSALVSTISIYDITMEGRVIISETYLTFEIWFTIAVIYLMITATLSVFVNRMEKRFKIAA